MVKALPIMEGRARRSPGYGISPLEFDLLSARRETSELRGTLHDVTTEKDAALADIAYLGEVLTMAGVDLTQYPREVVEESLRRKTDIASQSPSFEQVSASGEVAQFAGEQLVGAASGASNS